MDQKRLIHNTSHLGSPMSRMNEEGSPIKIVEGGATPIFRKIGSVYRPKFQNTNKDQRNRGSQKLKTHLLQEVPSILKKENILMGDKTFNNFYDPDRFLRDSILETEKKMRTKPVIIKKGDFVVTNSHQKNIDHQRFRRRREGGKMFINELWSKKHYSEILHNTMIWDQNNELIKASTETTEKKMENYERFFYSHMNPLKEQIVKQLFDKHSKEQKISKEDVLMKTDYDLAFKAWDSKSRSCKLQPTVKARGGSLNASPNKCEQPINNRYSFGSTDTRDTSPDMQEIQEDTIILPSKFHSIWDAPKSVTHSKAKLPSIANTYNLCNSRKSESSKSTNNIFSKTLHNISLKSIPQRSMRPSIYGDDHSKLNSTQNFHIRMSSVNSSSYEPHSSFQKLLDECNEFQKDDTSKIIQSIEEIESQTASKDVKKYLTKEELEEKKNKIRKREFIVLYKDILKFTKKFSQ